MACRAYLGKIRKGKQQEYIEAHKAVWPELIDVMKQAGVTRESCFVLDDHVFVYVEAADIDATMERLASNPVNQKWDVFMESILELPSEERLGLFPEMMEVFRM